MLKVSELQTPQNMTQIMNFVTGIGKLNNVYNLGKKCFTKMTNKTQQCRIIYCSLAALPVLSDIFAYHQEHLNCIYSSWCYTRESLPGWFQRLTCIIPEAANKV